MSKVPLVPLSRLLAGRGARSAPPGLLLDNPKISRRFKVARAAIPLQLRGPVLWKSWWQIANTFIPFFAVCAFMHFAVGAGHWEALLLVPLATGFLVRIFIIQHDCGHGAFFRSARANDWLGRICGVLTLTPYDYWRRQHHGHHTRWNCLDRRGADIDTYSKRLTVVCTEIISANKHDEAHRGRARI